MTDICGACERQPRKARATGKDAGIRRRTGKGLGVLLFSRSSERASRDNGTRSKS